MVSLALHALASFILLAILLFGLAGITYDFSGEKKFWVWYLLWWGTSIVLAALCLFAYGVVWVVCWALREVSF